jgi:SWI/SNF-related matrix-associated actin-dependent regulator 1 of chromatin subfamily A
MFPHQHVGTMRIAEGEPTYLGFDMGIGKTRTFIEAAKLRRARRVLVLCPATALLVWKREIALWHPGAVCVVVRNPSHLKMEPADGATGYYVVSHGLMSQKPGPVAEALAEVEPFDMTAIDEAQAFNAPSNNRVNALRRAAPKLGDIVPLSGTPMKNHAGDLYTLLSICWPQGLKGLSRAAYEERFCQVDHRRFSSGGPMVRVITGSKNLGVLKSMIAPFMLRVRKEDVFKDLPAILWDTVPVPLDDAHMPPEALRLLDTVVHDILTTAGTAPSITDMAAALSKLSGSVSLMSLRRLLGLAKLRGAVEYIIDMLDNLPGNRKVLVFAHHADVIANLNHHLLEYSPAVLTGATSPKDREAAVDKFLNDPKCRVFIGNIQAAGTAITLVGPKCKCSDVVFVESSWTPMDNAQAACRVHRIGQHDGVVARMLSAAGTVDDLINGLLVRKAREFTQLFDTQTEGETK